MMGLNSCYGPGLVELGDDASCIPLLPGPVRGLGLPDDQDDDLPICLL